MKKVWLILLFVPWVFLAQEPKEPLKLIDLFLSCQDAPAELLSSLKLAMGQKPLSRAKQVVLNEQVFSLKVGDRIMLSGIDQGRFEAVIQKRIDANGFISLYGRREDSQEMSSMDTFTITRLPSRKVMAVISSNLHFYEIGYNREAKAYLLSAVNFGPRKLRGGHPTPPKFLSNRCGTIRRSRLTKAGENEPRLDQIQKKYSSDFPYATTIRFLYTQAVQNHLGLNELKNRLYKQLIHTNTAIVNSLTNGLQFYCNYNQSELIEGINYTETNMNTDLERLATPFDGQLDAENNFSGYSTADDLVVLVGYYPGETQWAGVTYGLRNEFGDPRLRFIVLNVDCLDQPELLIHEIGHVFGAGHYFGQLTQPGPQLFSFSSGWKTELTYHLSTNEPRKICTIMTYLEDSIDSQCMRFSNPDLYIDRGYTTCPIRLGNPDLANNTWTIQYMSESISNYEKRKNQFPLSFGNWGTTGHVDRYSVHSIFIYFHYETFSITVKNPDYWGIRRFRLYRSPSGSEDWTQVTELNLSEFTNTNGNQVFGSEYDYYYQSPLVENSSPAFDYKVEAISDWDIVAGSYIYK